MMTIHPEGNMNVCTKFKSNPSHCFWDVWFKTTNVGCPLAQLVAQAPHVQRLCPQVLSFTHISCNLQRCPVNKAIQKGHKCQTHSDARWRIRVIHPVVVVALLDWMEVSHLIPDKGQFLSIFQTPVYSLCFSFGGVTIKYSIADFTVVVFHRI